MTVVQDMIFENKIVRVHRKKKKSGMTLRANQAGGLEISTHHSVPDHEIVSFLNAKRSWIEKSLREIEFQNRTYRSKSFADGDVFPFLGKDHKLRYQFTLLEEPFLVRADGAFTIYWPYSQRDITFQEKSLLIFVSKWMRYLRKRVDGR